MDITHEPGKNRFVTSTPDGEEAFIRYELSGNSVNFDKTLVPEAFRGQGVAKKLVEEALAWAEQEKLQVSATCSYVQKFL